MSSADAVRALIGELVSQSTTGGPARGGTAPVVPDLGLVSLMDQLRVAAYDARLAGVPLIDERLAELRRSLT